MASFLEQTAPALDGKLTASDSSHPVEGSSVFVLPGTEIFLEFGFICHACSVSPRAYRVSNYQPGILCMKSQLKGCILW